MNLYEALALTFHLIPLYPKYITRKDLIDKLRRLQELIPLGCPSEVLISKLVCDEMLSRDKKDGVLVLRTIPTEEEQVYAKRS